MPDRIIRDELLRSHRYVGLPTDTDRLLFVHLILSADSLGNAEATATCLTLMMARPIDDSLAAKLLAHLADVDLIRVYESGGKRYVHIPRFRQRLRYLNGKHPRPPSKLECNEMKELLSKVSPQSDRGQTTVRLQSAEVKRSEEKKNIKTVGLRRSVKTPLPDGFALSESVISWGVEKRVFNLDAHFEHFVNVAKARDYRYADWDRAFQNAVLSDWAKIGRGTDPAKPRKVSL